jgi:hypothetical protein
MRIERMGVVRPLLWISPRAAKFVFSVAPEVLDLQCEGKRS